MHALSLCLSQLLVLVLFIAVTTNTENSQFFLILYSYNVVIII